MPIFEFRCKDCGRIFEILFRSRDEKVKTTCPACKSNRAEKVFSVFSSRVESHACGPCAHGEIPSPADCSACGQGFS